MDLERVRSGFLGLLVVLALLGAWQYRRLWRSLRLFFTEPQSALNLALLRILVAWTMVRQSIYGHAGWYAELPEEFRHTRRGWEPIAEYIPYLLPWADFGEKVTLVASLLAMLGLCSRFSIFVAALMGTWVFGVQQMYFKPTHGMNVPVLTAYMLALTPCGDAFSIDALLRRMRGIARPGPSVAYSLPVRFAWLLLASSYLFPGIAKLWTSGDLWLDGTRMHVSLHEKWAQLPDYTPLFRPDAYPWMLVFFGAGTLVFEIFFTPALFFRSTRVLAGLTASAFHLGVGLAMAIWFDILYPVMVFFDFPQILNSRVLRPVAKPLQTLAAKSREISAKLDTKLAALGQRLRLYRERPARRRTWVGGALVGAAMLYGMVWAGFTEFNSWPISIYPKFASRTSRPLRTSSALLFVARREDGTERPLVNSYYPVEDSASIHQVLRSVRKADEETKLDAYRFLARIVLGNNPPLEPGERVVIKQYDFFVDPARRVGDQPKYRELAVFRPPPHVPAPK